MFFIMNCFKERLLLLFILLMNNISFYKMYIISIEEYYEQIYNYLKISINIYKNMIIILNNFKLIKL